MLAPDKVRHTRSHPCLICGGIDEAPRGKDIRCFGFQSGDWAHCTREEHAGPLARNTEAQTYAHRLSGECGCGVRHGSTPQTRPPNGATRPKTAIDTYDYVDAGGQLRYQVCRFAFDDNGDKTFRQRRPDDNDGWTWNLKGIEPLPYRLPELLAAPPGTTIFVPEGEKDVDRLIGLGFVASCNSGGAEKFQPEIVHWFEGRNVILLQDNDDAGHRHLEKSAALLHPIVESIKRVAFSDMGKGADVSDWLDAGHTADDLLEIAEASLVIDQGFFRNPEPPMLGGSEETRKIVIIPSTEVPPPGDGEGDDQLGPFVPPPHALVLLSGESSAGKTVLTYNFGYHLAEGTEVAGLDPLRPIRVLYVDLESPDNVHQTLVDTVGRSDNFAFIRNLRDTLDTDTGRQEFLDACRDYQPGVVVIDPLSIAWPVGHEDDNAAADRQMWSLKQIAVELNCIIIALWNMGEGNVKDKFKARGATARIDRSDLALNYMEVSDTTRELKIVKSRYGTRGISLTVKFSGDMGFEEVDVPGGQSVSAIMQYQRQIKEMAKSGRITRKEVVEVLQNEDMADKALGRLVKAGDLRKVRRGEYELAVSSEPPNIRDSDSEEDSAKDEGEV